MIKIEYVEGTGTITRETGEESAIFAGMTVTAEEIVTLECNGDVIYTIDEQRVVTVPKGTKAEITSLTSSTEGTEFDKAGDESMPKPNEVLQAVIDADKAKAEAEKSEETKEETVSKK